MRRRSLAFRGGTSVSSEADADMVELSADASMRRGEVTGVADLEDIELGVLWHTVLTSMHTSSSVSARAAASSADVLGDSVDKKLLAGATGCVAAGMVITGTEEVALVANVLVVIALGSSAGAGFLDSASSNAYV